MSESGAAGVKKALRFARCALATATAWKQRYAYAHVPMHRLLEVGLVRNSAEARKHPLGMIPWVDYDGEYWHLGIDTYSSGTYLYRGPYEYNNMHEVLCKMLDFAKFFLEEPRLLTEVELELPVEEHGEYQEGSA